MLDMRLKHRLFQYSGALTTLLGVVAVACVWLFGGQNWQLALTAAGGALSFAYFAQKQKLEERRLFKELFTEFNARYDKLQPRLLSILPNTEEELSSDELLTAYEYFNLCGEEYLFYRLGYIDPAAWRAWQNGMRVHLKNPRIARFWEKEASSDSYYGLQMPSA